MKTTQFNNKFESLLTEDSHRLQLSSNANFGAARMGMGMPTDECDVMLEKLNSVVTHISNTPALNPYYAVERIKRFLNMAFDLTFNDCYMVGDIGTVSEPLFSRTAGISGHEFNHKSVVDNGFLKPFPEGLKIVFTFLKVKGLYTIEAHIEKNSVPPPTIVSEEK
jgi:hypothetical protein